MGKLAVARSTIVDSGHDAALLCVLPNQFLLVEIRGKGTGHLWRGNWLISLERIFDSWRAGNRERDKETESVGS